MRESLDNKLSRSRVHRRLLQRRWQRVVSALGCIVVFCVTYALILPAITLTNKTPVCGMDEQDEECSANIVTKDNCRQEIEAAMSNAFGFGGQNSSIIVGKYKADK